MTRAEAIKQIESLFEHCEAMMTSDEPVWSQDCEALKVALFALRGPTRERVEKVWRVCDSCEIPCNNCERIYEWDRYGKPQECIGCPENGYKTAPLNHSFVNFAGDR